MSKYQLYPYDGKSNIRDEDWVFIWNKMVEQELDKVVFCGDGISGVFDFIALMKKCLPTVVVDMDKDEPVAVAWLADVVRSLGFGHFVFFKEVWGTGDAELIGKDILDFWFENLKFKLILGVIPAFNTHAIKYMDNLGMVMMDTIPHLVPVNGEEAPGILGYITKEMFDG